MPKMRVCAVPTQPRKGLLYVWKAFVYQFAIIKPGLAVCRMVLFYVDRFEPFEFEIAQVFDVIRYIMICSLLVAMFGLLNIYRTFSQGLKPFKVRAETFLEKTYKEP